LFKIYVMDILNTKNLFDKMSKFLGNGYEPVYDNKGLPSKIKTSLDGKVYDLTTQYSRNILHRSISSDLCSLGVDPISSKTICEMYVSKLYDDYKKAVLSL